MKERHGQDESKPDKQALVEHACCGQHKKHSLAISSACKARWVGRLDSRARRSSPMKRLHDVRVLLPSPFSSSFYDFLLGSPWNPQKPPIKRKFCFSSLFYSLVPQYLISQTNFSPSPPNSTSPPHFPQPHPTQPLPCTFSSHSSLEFLDHILRTSRSPRSPSHPPLRKWAASWPDGPRLPPPSRPHRLAPRPRPPPDKKKPRRPPPYCHHCSPPSSPVAAT